MKKIFLPLLALALFLTPVFASLNSQPQIVIVSQPDSPLQLSDAVPKFEIIKEIDGREWKQLYINLSKKNISQKTIRAYTLIVPMELEWSGLTCPSSSKGLLHINQQRKGEINLGSYDEDSPKKIEISVDFVEFTDGTTWGLDVSNSSQTLAGMRAGGKAGQEYLLKIKGEKGINRVIEAVDEVQNISLPENQNNDWQRGFKIGLRSLSSHIKNAYKKEGIKGIEIELQKPQFLPV